LSPANAGNNGLTKTPILDFADEDSALQLQIVTVSQGFGAKNVTDTSIRHANNDAFTWRPLVFLLSLSVLLSMLLMFLGGGLIQLTTGLLVIVFLAYLLIATLSAAFHARWRHLISIVLGASAAIGAFYLASLLSYALEPPIFHYKLSGPDWARIPEGYSGVTPEKIVAELNIPKEYLTRYNKSPSQPQSNISINVFYPSMKGAVRGGSPEPLIGAIIGAAREDHFRKGVRSFIRDGVAHDPSLDVNGLCGYVDLIHPGYAGDELFIACNETDQTFTIICFAPSNGYRLCTEDAFVGGEIGAQIFYHDSLLKEHQAMLGAFKRLVLSFAQSTEPAGQN
jgi:hypothetical protein